ncbi:MAG: CRISPR-associated helicase/endonuclease Cas3 [Thermoplasmata archaeon]|nr:MAG: CRISPR-associated helicase/endonuclease Cas3 [Thermoplasmata archaeon]
MEFEVMFEKAAGYKPFDYQKRLATEYEMPSILNVPTGMGKTAAAILGWLWRRRFAPDHIRETTPRRLIYCLPMRVLVEQTRDNAVLWLHNLDLLGGIAEIEGEKKDQKLKKYSPSWEDSGKINVTVLMGGEDRDDWDLHPERDAIIIGTQDMLLSRALNRGYGMSRYRWPVHFGLLNNDCLWVMDEVQLMGVGLETTAQMDAFRKKLGTFGNSKSLWMSATMDESRLQTVDNKIDKPMVSISDEDLGSELLRKMSDARKTLERAENIFLDKESSKGKYFDDLARMIADYHISGYMTLVILNTVKRAQELFKRMEKVISQNGRLVLLHSRFREDDRSRNLEALGNEGDLIVISTQIVEAGMDISARTMFTELAPWSSMVQRFGRCNRKGEFEESKIVWIDLDTEKMSSPYDDEDLEVSRKVLKGIEDANPKDLSEMDVSGKDVVRPQIRRKDLLELFDTTPDLSGNDLDISRYVREVDEKDVQVYWRDIPEEGPSNDIKKAHRRELCSAPLVDVKKCVEKKNFNGYMWDHLEERWGRLNSSTPIVPGSIILLDTKSGGYSVKLGWLGKDWNKNKDGIVEEVHVDTDIENESVNSEIETFIGRDITITEHCRNVSDFVGRMSTAIGLGNELADALSKAGLWHDVGKAHEAFQNSLRQGRDDIHENVLLAKSRDRKGRMRYFTCEDGVEKERRYFRHELASALAWLKNGGKESKEGELIAYLVGAHHGKVRMSIRSLPGETEPDSEGLRYARGVWDGDRIPQIDGILDRDIVLDMEPMELGEGSWLEISLEQLDRFGPFKLSYLESILRISDWIVSGKEEKGVGS